MPWAYIRTKDKFDGTIFVGLIYPPPPGYIQEEKHFNLQTVKLFFFPDFLIISSHKW